MTTHLLAAVLLLCGGFLYLPTCARAEDRFRSPPKPGPTGDYRDNPVYALGDSIDLQWDTSLESADLVLWQEQTYGDAPPASVTLAANAKAKTLVWTVGYAGFPAYHDPNLSPVYYLELSKAGETAAAAGVRSHYFNITASAGRTTATTARLSRPLSAVAAETKTRAATTTITITTNTTTTATTSTGSSATADAQATATTIAPDPEDEAGTAPPTPTPTPTADGSGAQPQPQPQSTTSAGGGRLSGGAVAGVAVCATLGGLALLGAAAWAVRRRVWRAGGGGVAHTQGDIFIYAEQQLRENGAVGWGSPPSPLRRKVRLPAEESREALGFELDGAAENADWAAWGVAAALDRAAAAGCGSQSSRSSWGWRSQEARSWA
ncbi:hypothetical protein LZ32DRAFT_654399 [Colletotrichum eremochloae]|nr:hypothetical protein LZ32DRAFT_654399 [Colletotrichum eremochloae]